MNHDTARLHDDNRSDKPIDPRRVRTFCAPTATLLGRLTLAGEGRAALVTTASMQET
jgi:hypothetical protein